MKRLIVLLSVLAIISCKEEPKEYATLSGKITNFDDSKIVTILKGRDYKREIKMKDDGTFSDTLKVEEGIYYFKHGDEYGQVFLKNNNNTSLSLDNTDFDNTLKFEGDDANRSNFYIAKTLMVDQYLDNETFDLPEDEFNKAVSGLKDGFTKLKTEFPGLDETFFQDEEKNLDNIIKSYTDYYQSKLAMRKAFPAGTPSPTFENYENFKGGTTSLSDLKGKYVYVDVWATWCGPCKREIPSLKKLEKEYHGKNIEFVSISVDDAKRSGSMEKANADWKKMVAEKELSGVQLFSDKAWNSDFVQAYKIQGIPRFILIDPNGNIVNPDAPRPSSSALVELFNSLNI